MGCCDRGYDRPSLRAVGSTLRPVSPTGWKRSRKPGALACRALQGTIKCGSLRPPAMTRWPARLALPVRHRLRRQAIAGRARMAGRHTLLHDLERTIRAISGLAGFLYLGLGVFMQNTDQGP